MKPKNLDAIVAIATAPGKGGVGVVRVSLPQLSQAQALFLALFPKLAQRYSTQSLLLPPARYAHWVRLFDRPNHGHDEHCTDKLNSSRMIDEGLLLYFSAPASYTGEHVFEFQGHGGPAVLQAVVDRWLEAARHLGLPLRHAYAGEFTQRAFLNDKIDLAQAEAVADLIDAGSERAAKAAAASLSGVFSNHVQTLADGLLHLRMLLEATLDFPEEELDFLQKADALGQLHALLHTHTQLLQAAREGMRFRDGLTVVLAGLPNVGKSSLMNALAGDDVAIVSPVAGTTRDRISQAINIRGIPLVLVDTAGLRDTEDEVEQMGISRTLASLAKADVVLLLEDATQINVRSSYQPDQAVPCLRVINKVDLRPNWQDDLHQTTFKTQNDVVQPPRSETIIAISAKTGQGLEDLKTALLAAIGVQAQPSENAFTARQRHVDALKRCGQHLVQAAACAAQGDQVLDIFAEELRLAHDCLGEITGRMSPDELLGVIFSRFCMGK